MQDVQFGAGEAPLLIVKAGANQYEIPYAEAYLKNTDLEHKKIVMTLPEGMLELNAPLTAEEKEQQRKQQEAVILSGVAASRSETVAESKDPYLIKMSGYRGLRRSRRAKRGSVAQHDNLLCRSKVQR